MEDEVITIFSASVFFSGRESYIYFPHFVIVNIIIKIKQIIIIVYVFIRGDSSLDLQPGMIWVFITICLKIFSWWGADGVSDAVKLNAAGLKTQSIESNQLRRHWIPLLEF